MYAIIEVGGKQYKVEEGMELYTEKLVGYEPGAEVVLDKVLFVKGDSAKIGKPYVENAKVVAEVVKHGKDKKVLVVKFQGRKNYRRKKGHRQHYTALKIKKIEA
ncbi:50S ribosomal protein L21 [Marinitoga sp. 1135]|uniref:Large ribosomal subunit protein bL21 n=1 Tax=Marinitoga piezophila (strain DSM 14283 / JCM 11233 / KA3) TaxID=443254 RepID=H2J537_MARPK|nr:MULTISPECIES: 50S ribosomal protein L21 [Marinitoga]AEX86054.1 ribosomal protein L21 [Marinitoga piezophila KA3]APT76473.1 50S ribosomal protein L21 [Marinitoga sp. 1137]NUU96243.1 50S ribosomal protein L21 [Marinitoga sp. 1135]NUU98162.1 50S ribosomal protein L21 [Marinitoga sp. 1138]